MKVFFRRYLLNSLKLLLILSIPIFLFLLNLYFLVTKEFVSLLYNTIPESYRFTKEERIFYSGLIIDFLKFNTDSSEIEILQDNNGKMFMENEIAHLKDVQSLLLIALKMHLLSAVTIISSAFILKNEKISIRKYFVGGSLLTILITAIFISFAFLNFNLIFIYFHQILFAPGSYAFLQSDTLIQLFPQKFWVNSSIIFISLTFFEAIFFFLIVLKANRNKEKLNKLVKQFNIR